MIELIDEDLRQYTPDFKVIRKARKFIAALNEANIHCSNVLAAGTETQENHSKILGDIFTLSSFPTLRKAKDSLGIILELLEGSGKKGWFQRKIEPVELQRKISELSGKVKNYVAPLLNLIRNIDETQGKLAQIKKDLEPFIVALTFCSKYEKEGLPTDLFTSRLTSLVSTESTIGLNTEQLKTLKQIVLNLIDTINNIVLTELPLWVTGCISAKLEKNVSEALENQRLKLIQKFKERL